MDHRDILIDAARRPVDSARQVLEGIGSDALNQMPDGEHSSIAWLIWHAARQQDAQIADISDARRWVPPVTRGARIVSTIDDAVAHVGQAAYLRGLLEDWRIGY
jgi:hypothetical protein